MNNESFDDLLNRLNNQEKQQVIEYAYMYDDLRYLREHGRYLQDKLKAYKNVIKEANNFIQENKNKTMANYGDDYDYEVCLFEEDIKDLLNILNKVGSDK